MPLKPVSKTGQSETCDACRVTSGQAIDDEDVDSDEKERLTFGVIEGMAYVVYEDGSVDIGADGTAVRLPGDAVDCILSGTSLVDYEDMAYQITDSGGLVLYLDGDGKQMEVPAELASRVTEDYREYVM